MMMVRLQKELQITLTYTKSSSNFVIFIFNCIMQKVAETII